MPAAHLFAESREYARKRNNGKYAESNGKNEQYNIDHKFGIIHIAERVAHIVRTTERGKHKEQLSHSKRCYHIAAIARVHRQPKHTVCRYTRNYQQKYRSNRAAHSVYDRLPYIRTVCATHRRRYHRGNDEYAAKYKACNSGSVQRCYDISAASTYRTACAQHKQRHSERIRKEGCRGKPRYALLRKFKQLAHIHDDSRYKQ